MINTWGNYSNFFIPLHLSFCIPLCFLQTSKWNIPRELPCLALRVKGATTTLSRKCDGLSHVDNRVLWPALKYRHKAERQRDEASEDEGARAHRPRSLTHVASWRVWMAHNVLVRQDNTSKEMKIDKIEYQ